MTVFSALWFLMCPLNLIQSRHQSLNYELCHMLENADYTSKIIGGFYIWQNTLITESPLHQFMKTVSGLMVQAP